MESKALKKRKYPWAAPTGAAILLLSLLGLATVIYLLVGLVQHLTDDTKQREDLSNYLYPVAMLDPIAFEGVDKADQKMMTQAAIWGCLMETDKNIYATDDMGRMLIPVASIEAEFIDLFGDSQYMLRESFEDGATFEYSLDNNGFYVPVIGQFGLYTPKVTKIEKDHGNLILTVAYYANDTTEEDLFGTKSEPTIEKYMIYVLHQYTVKEPKKQTKYAISAVRQGQVLTAPGSSSSSNAQSQAAS